MGHRIVRRQQLVPVAAPLAERFGLFRESLEVRTNDERILAAARAAFGGRSAMSRGPADDPGGRDPLVLRLVVDAPDPAAPPTPVDVRQLRHDTAGHLFVIRLGVAGEVVVDLAGGFALGRVSPGVAADPGLVRTTFVEAAALAMLTGGRGYVPVHAAGLVRDGVGVIVQGPAGAGKSTFAMAAIRRGWSLLADDVVFVAPVASDPGGSPDLELWGLPWRLQLLADVVRFFPELDGRQARLQPNGETKLEIDVQAEAPGRTAPMAAAGPIVLLDRTPGPTTTAWLDPRRDPAAVEVLWPWEAGWTAGHDRTAARLLQGGVLRLSVGGSPEGAVIALESALESAPESAPESALDGSTASA